MMYQTRRSADAPSVQIRALLVGVCLALAMAGCSDGLRELPEARQLTIDLRVQFNKASAASIRAVMADTDGASIAFAREAEQAKQSVKSDATALIPLFRTLGLSSELRLLEEFSRHFEQYQKLDHTILELAVENTNLKAQKLSFGPVRDAADTFQRSLDALTQAAPPKTRCQIESLAKSAELAVREIQILHAPHIAEAQDAAMSALEKEMQKGFETAHGALNSLSSLIPPSSHAELDAAKGALERLKGLHDQIITLSRRNSNVRSLELALGQGRTLATDCDTSLSMLQDALSKEGFKATR